MKIKFAKHSDYYLLLDLDAELWEGDLRFCRSVDYNNQFCDESQYVNPIGARSVGDNCKNCSKIIAHLPKFNKVALKDIYLLPEISRKQNWIVDFLHEELERWRKLIPLAKDGREQERRLIECDIISYIKLSLKHILYNGDESVDELARKYAMKNGWGNSMNDMGAEWCRRDFKAGYNMAKQTEKRYSEEDLREAHLDGTILMYNRKSLTKEERLKDFVDVLKKINSMNTDEPTDFEVEIENIETDGDSNSSYFFDYKQAPKVINGVVQGKWII
jgi:hypothetical protein